MRMIPSVRSFLFAAVMLGISAVSFAQIGVAITVGPPALPVYEQPICPGDGYLWTPGYWAYDYDVQDYYWVPGTWVEAPEVGYLWTPGYWGWGGNAFLFHEGYWGPHVGFYGGVSYGFGYFGEGYEGGRWDNGHFFYNRSVNNVNVVNIHNVYNTTIVDRTVVNRVSYNGGNGGINARPRPEDAVAERDKHIEPVRAQTQQAQTARSNPQLRASANQGRPPIAATSKAGEFHEGAVPAKEAGAPYRAPANRANASSPRPDNASPGRPENNVPRPPNAAHAKEVEPHTAPAPASSGNAKADQKYQQQQEKLTAKQNQEHQKLAQSQEQEHQKLAQQKAPEPRTQQVEQKHQQQTQQMEHKHTQQQQHLAQKQPAPPAHNEAKNESKPPR